MTVKLEPISSAQTSSPFMTLSEAAKTLPRINGRKMHVSTIFRWCRNGVRGVFLEYGKMGRTIVVTESGLRKFFTGLAEADKIGQATIPTPHKRRPRRACDASRQQDIQEANAVLVRAGIIKPQVVSNKMEGYNAVL